MQLSVTGTLWGNPTVSSVHKRILAIPVSSVNVPKWCLRWRPGAICAHLSDQFVADCIQLGLDALLALGGVLVVRRKVQTQELLHRPVIDGTLIVCAQSHAVNSNHLCSLGMRGVDATSG